MKQGLALPSRELVEKDDVTEIAHNLVPYIYKKKTKIKNLHSSVANFHNDSRAELASSTMTFRLLILLTLRLIAYMQGSNLLVSTQNWRPGDQCIGCFIDVVVANLKPSAVEEVTATFGKRTI